MIFFGHCFGNAEDFLEGIQLLYLVTKRTPIPLATDSYHPLSSALQSRPQSPPSKRKLLIIFSLPRQRSFFLNVVCSDIVTLFFFCFKRLFFWEPSQSNKNLGADSGDLKTASSKILSTRARDLTWRFMKVLLKFPSSVRIKSRSGTFPAGTTTTTKPSHHLLPFFPRNPLSPLSTLNQTSKPFRQNQIPSSSIDRPEGDHFQDGFNSSVSLFKRLYG